MRDRDSPRRSYRVEQLEPRLLLAADWAAGLAPAWGADGDTPLDHDDLRDFLPLSAEPGPNATLHTLLPGALDLSALGEMHEANDRNHVADHAALPSASVDNALRHEVVVIDAGVQGYEALVADFEGRNGGDTYYDVHVLAADGDGVQALTAILAGHSNLDALHIVSHGSNGGLQLGDTRLDSTSVDRYAQLIADWSAALDDSADVLIYGCDLAASDSGQRLIESLGALTQADVAASNNATGLAQLGGDWHFEFTRGAIESTTAFSAQIQDGWSGVLATFTVNTLADTVDVNPGDGVAVDAAGNTSLRAAIMEANSLAGADVINLPAGTYQLSIAGEDNTAEEGDLDITEALTLVGAGAGVTVIDAQGIDRVLHALATNVVINDVTLTGGVAMGGFPDGGALFVETAAYATLERVTITGNAAQDGGGIFANGGLTLYDVMVDTNNADQNGGGLRLGSDANVTAVTISDNKAQSGAGILVSSGGNVTLTNVTISGNDATGNGGGIRVQGDINLLNVTVTDNDAVGSGGGVLVNTGGSSFVASNSIFADNTAGSGSADFQGTVASDGSNIIKDNVGSTGFILSEVADPLLDPVLRANGGWTLTHALQIGSPAIDANTVLDAPTIDQRGFVRDSLPDIGAYELDASVASTGLWLSTRGDVVSSGAPELPAWSSGEVIRLSDPDLAFGTTSDGTWSSVVDFEAAAFSDGNLDIVSLHHVTTAMTLGGNGFPAIAVAAGDLLLITNNNETWTNTGPEPNVSVSNRDVVLFHPNIPGDYSSGTFSLLLDNPLGTTIEAISLVEADTQVGSVAGGTLLPAGSFVVVPISGSQIMAFTVDDVGLGSTTIRDLSGAPGLTTMILDGPDFGFTSRMSGIELIESDAIIAGTPVKAGDFLVSLTDSDAAIGDGVPISADQWDVVLVRAIATGATSSADAYVFLDGNPDVHLDATPEGIDGLTLAGAIEGGPSNNAPVANDDSYDVDLDTTLVVDAASGLLLNDTDPNFDPLTVHLLSGPSSGTLTLNPIGLSDLQNLSLNPGNDTFPDWSPDSSQLAFASARDGDFEIYVINADGTGLTQVTSTGSIERQPLWSPDGSQILYRSDADGTFDIYVMDADGSNPVRLTTGAAADGADELDASWSPDGTRIVYVMNNGTQTIYVMDADGSNVQSLTTPAAQDYAPAWSPDGMRIAFVSDRDGGDEIYVMDADGSNVVRLTTNGAFHGAPAWSPDGSKILFHSDIDGDLELFVMDADGSNVVQITDNLVNDRRAVWSPDGTRIAFETNRDGPYEVYVASIISGGGFSYTPKPGFTGVDSFTYRVTDGIDKSDPATVTLTVGGNSAPTATNLSQAIGYLEDGASVALADIVVTDTDAGETVTAALTLADVAAGVLSADSGNGETYTAGTGVWTITGTVAQVNAALADIVFIPAANSNVNTTITTHIEDLAGAGPLDGVITLSGTAVNDAPSFSTLGDQNVLEDSGPQSVAGFATALPGGGADESGQVFSYNVSSDNPGLFLVGPAIDASGTLTYTLNANVSGTARVTVSVSDDGGTANGGVDTSPDQTFDIIVGAVNDAPTVATNTGMTVTRGSFGNTITTAMLNEGDPDDSGTELTYTVTSLPSNGELRFFGVLLNVNETFTQDDIDNNRITYSHDNSVGNSDSFSFSLADGGEDGAAPATGVFNISIPLTNSAPALADADPTLAAIAEDNFTSAGDSVAAIVVDGSITDPDGSPVESIAITGVDDSNGVWQYSTDNGGTWTDVDDGSLGGDHALLLDGTLSGALTQRLRFVPDPDYNGNATFTFRAWDMSGGVAGTYADTTVSGGATPYSSATDAASIVVTAVNDAPSFSTLGDQNVLEDAGTQTVAGFASALPGGGADESGQTFSYTVNSDNPGLFLVGPAIDASGTLTYTLNSNVNGTARVTVSVTDTGGTANGGVDTSPDQTFDIIVGAVNDAPSFSILSDQAVLEDAGAQTVAGFATALPGGGADESGQTFSYNVSSDNPGLFLVGPAIDASGTLTYTLSSDVNGTARVTVSVTDTGGTANGGVDTSADQTFDIIVGAVNDAPSFSTLGDQTVLEDAGAQTVAGFATALPGGGADESGQTFTYTVSSDNPGLFLVGPAIDASGTLTYTLISNVNGTARVTVSVTDTGGTANGGVDTSPDQTFDIIVGAVNDAPSFSILGDQAVLEDAGAQTVAGFATALPGGGADESGQTFSYNVSSDNPGLFLVGPAIDASGTLTYTLSSDVNGTARVTVSVTDTGGTANGGVDTSADQTFDIIVGAVNDAPSFSTLGDQNVLEDAGTQTVAGFASALPGGGADESGQTFSYTVNSDNPGLFLVGPAIDASGTLTYTLISNVNGTARVTVSVTDTGGTANGGVDTSPDQTFDIIVGAVNDAPSFSILGDQAVLEDAGAQTVAGFATALPGGGADESGQTFSYNVSSDNPGLFLVGPAIDASGTLTYTLSSDVNGTARVTVSVTDTGGTANGGVDTSADQTFDIIVGAVNDAPSFSTLGDQTVLEDAGAQTVAGFATALPGGGADESGQTFTYTVSSDNPGLFLVGPAIDASGTLTYTLNSNVNGTARITVSVTDTGGTANGGVDTSPDQTFDIIVGAVNDAPSFSILGDQAVLEDAGAQTVAGFATALPGGGADESGQTFSYNVSSDNPGLFLVGPAIDASGTLTYTLSSDVNGTARVTVSVTDTGGTANGGVDTSADQTFDIIVGAVNDAPSFSTLGDQTVLEDAGAQTVAGFATALPGGGADESGQTFTYTVSSDNPGLFLVGPAIDASGTLTYTLNSNVNGTARITVSVTDTGGTANGGVDAAPDQTFAITVIPVDNAVTATGLTQSHLYVEDSGPVALHDILVNVAAGNNLITATLTLSDTLTGSLSANSGNGETYSSITGQWTVTGTVAQVNAALDAVQFLPVADNDVNSTVLTHVQNADGLGPAEGQITLSVTPVNDAPQGNDSLVLLTGDSVYVLSMANFGFSDPVEGDLPRSVQITSLPTWAGSLMLDDQIVTVGDSVSASDIEAGRLRFIPLYGIDGTLFASLAFQVQDDGGTAAGGIDLDPSENYLTLVVTQASEGTVGTTVDAAPTAGPQQSGEATAPQAQAHDSAVVEETVNEPGASADGEPEADADSPDAQAAPEPVDIPTVEILDVTQTQVIGIDVFPHPTVAADAPANEVTVAVDDKQAAVMERQFAAYEPLMTESQDIAIGIEQMRDALAQDIATSTLTLGGTAVSALGLSVGYVSWLLRGSVLLGSVVSSLPVWTFIDPLPVFARDSDERDEDGEDQSLAAIVRSGAAANERANAPLPEPGQTGAPDSHTDNR